MFMRKHKKSYALPPGGSQWDFAALLHFERVQWASGILQ